MNEQLSLLETKPGEQLLYVIRNKLIELDCGAAWAEHGVNVLKIFQGSSEQLESYEQWSPALAEDHVYVHRYNPDKAKWRLVMWSRPVENSIPMHLRNRVDKV